MELLSFAEKYLLAKDAKCGRHCDQTAKFTPINEEKTSLVGAYVCPQGYVSRAVYFSDRPDAKWFLSFLSDQLGSQWVRSRDIRMATRFGWELGGSAEDEIKQVSKTGKIVQYYWTFYPQNDEEKARGTFLCSNCKKLFVKLKSDPSLLCPKCTSS